MTGGDVAKDPLAKMPIHQLRWKSVRQMIKWKSHAIQIEGKPL